MAGPGNFAGPVDVEGGGEHGEGGGVVGVGDDVYERLAVVELQECVVN